MRLGDSRTRDASPPQSSGAETGRPSAPASVPIAFSRCPAGGPSAAPDEGGESDYEFLSAANAPGSLDVIKTVPMPVFPIRVLKAKPPPFSLELQRRKIRWRYCWLGDFAPECIQHPTDYIQDTARLYIESITSEANLVCVTLLARGSFNLAYNVIAENVTTGFHREYVFRVSLPIWPYYKVESDVATTEFVRHATNHGPNHLCFRLQSRQ